MTDNLNNSTLITTTSGTYTTSGTHIQQQQQQPSGTHNIGHTHTHTHNNIRHNMHAHTYFGTLVLLIFLTFSQTILFAPSSNKGIPKLSPKGTHSDTSLFSTSLISGPSFATPPSVPLRPATMSSVVLAVPEAVLESDPSLVSVPFWRRVEGGMSDGVGSPIPSSCISCRNSEIFSLSTACGLLFAVVAGFPVRK